MTRLRWLVLLAAVSAALLAPLVARAQQAAQPGDNLPALVQDMTSEDAAVRTRAFDSLRALGADGVKRLLALLVEPGQGEDAGVRMALHGMAAYHSRPGAGNERAAFANALLPYLDGKAPAPLKCFVIAQLQICGRDESVPGLAACLLDEALADFATQALSANPTPPAAKALRDAIPKTQGPVRVGIILALGYKRDVESVPALLTEAASAQADIRLAAIESLGRIGDARAEAVIAGALRRGTEREQRTAFDAYLRLGERLLAAGKRPEALKVYTRALPAAPQGHSRVAALLGVAKVGSPDLVKVILPYAADPDPAVREVAAACLAQLPGAEVSTEIAAAMKNAEPKLKGALLRLLAQRKEPTATAAIEEAAKDPNLEIRVTALYLLDRLNDPALEPTLLDAATKGSDLIHPVALEAYMKLADGRLRNNDKAGALAMYTRALEVARQDALRRAALQGLAAAPSVDSLPKVEALLQNEALRGDALRAYVAIAATVSAAGEKQRAIDMLQRALQMGPPRDVADNAVAELRQLGIKVDPAMAAGFVTTWWIMGPFAGEAVDEERPPEKAVDLKGTVRIDNRDVAWLQHHTTDSSGIVDLFALLNPNNNVTGYMYAEVTVAQAQDVLLKIGSDDGAKCWLNGQVVHRFPEPRSLVVDQDTVKAHLNAGANKLLLKVVQGGGEWAACLRLTDPDGKAIKFEQKEE